MTSSVAKQFPADYQEHEFSRRENDRELLGSLARLRNAEDMESLERFAKAYLGMYLDMNNSIPPADRIDVLANPELANAIRQGFIASLSLNDYPSARLIADTMEQDHLPIGYVLLAAMSMYCNDPANEVSSLSEATIIAAICFHHAYKTEHEDRWIQQVMHERSAEVISALQPFWQRLIQNGTDHLPGMVAIIDSANTAILHEILLPVLNDWTTISKKNLRCLLHISFTYCDHAALLDVARNRLQVKYEPARYTLWLATAFLLQPEQFALTLIDYCGRSKEKIIPLLDFSYLVLNNQAVELSPSSLGVLLRIIAPKITPQEDRYGALCDNSRRILYLFYLLAMSADPSHADEVNRLLQVRVMKLYKPILTYQPESLPLAFDDYINQLLEHNLIRRRIKRYD